MGSCSVEVAPSPNSQYHDWGIFSVVSLNWTGDEISVVSVLTVKFATGASGIPVTI